MVLALLISARLGKYASAFEHLGVAHAQDFKYVAEDDLVEMGMSELEKRRFQNNVLLSLQ